MFNIDAKTNFVAAKVIKQVNYGTAVGLTRTAQKGQEAVVGALGSAFTLRGNWFQKQNKYGIKITPAKPDNLESQVKTLADWLALHETGGTKTAQGDVAVPTDQVRRNKKLIIPRAQRPRGLGAKAFIIQTKHGPVLAARKGRGKNKQLVFLYNLKKSVPIKKQSTFFEPLEKLIKSGETGRQMAVEIQKALDNIRW